METENKSTLTDDQMTGAETLPETVTTNATSEEQFPTPTPLDLMALESMLTEAEQRGYDRARSEIAEEEMRRPIVGEQPDAAIREVSQENFLINRRRSVWD